MKITKCILAAIIFFVLIVSAVVSDESEDETVFKTDAFSALMLNGKAWVKLDMQSRIMYLNGIENGAALLIAEMDSVQSEKENARVACRALERLTVKGFRFSDIMKEIDSFYDQSSNRRIPVVDAYRYVLKKFKGATPEQLASAQAALRAKYNK